MRFNTGGSPANPAPTWRLRQSPSRCGAAAKNPAPLRPRGGPAAAPLRRQSTHILKNIILYILLYIYIIYIVTYDSAVYTTRLEHTERITHRV
jgi:hypothetical protein